MEVKMIVKKVLIFVPYIASILKGRLMSTLTTGSQQVAPWSKMGAQVNSQQPLEVIPTLTTYLGYSQHVVVDLSTLHNMLWTSIVVEGQLCVDLSTLL